MDPFTQVHQAIWSALNSDGDFASLVRVANRIDLTQPANQRLREQIQSADTPEVVLLQGEFVLQPFGSNSVSALLSQAYSLVGTFASMQIVPLNQLKWAALCALARAGPSLGLPFVQQWSISGQDEPLGKKPWVRDSQRWISVMSILVQMVPARSNLLERSGEW